MFINACGKNQNNFVISIYKGGKLMPNINKKSIQVVFRFDSMGRKSVFNRCDADMASCPVLKYLDGLELEHSVLREVPGRIKVIRSAALPDEQMTDIAIKLADYLCKNCGGKQR